MDWLYRLKGVGKAAVGPAQTRANGCTLSNVRFFPPGGSGRKKEKGKQAIKQLRRKHHRGAQQSPGKAPLQHWCWRRDPAMPGALQWVLPPVSDGIGRHQEESWESECTQPIAELVRLVS